MQKDTAARFIRDTFQPKDRLAIVVINKRSGAVTQRVANAEQVASGQFQSWLRYQNSQGSEVFFTPNALLPEARGRTKADVSEVRHLYLDFDDSGTAKVQRLMKREDLPKPSYVINSSPDHWQTFWRVQGFAKDEAETLMRHLVRELGADPAATDCSRVMRLPGFYNHKYGRRHYVAVEHLGRDTYGPEHFPRPPADERGQRSTADPPKPTHGTDRLSQSELDFAYAKRALHRGEAVEAVVAAIARYREDEKHNVWDYAERTVRKAADNLHNDSESRDLER